MAGTTEPVLDLTNSHLHTLDGVKIHESLTAVDLTANRFTTIEPGILALTGLCSLSFRQNLIQEGSVADSLASKSVLQNLELRDNQLKQVPELHDFNHLTRLELSYNQISSIAPLSSLGAAPLTELYLACNKVKVIESLSQLTSLRVLELGSNRISSLDGLQSLVNLEELWMGHNRITDISNHLAPLVKLRKLSLQSNRLTSMDGVQHLTALEELHLSYNGIISIQGLELLTQLQLLDVSSNGITEVTGLDTLAQLQDLWLNHNRLSDFKQLSAALQPIAQTITTIYLEGNELAKQDDYKAEVLKILPNLKQLDADDV